MITVLSLFDGISCAQEALKQQGIQIDKYYASEIDKYAIATTLKNHPDTVHIGDVNDIDFTQYLGQIDLLVGGSPCQDLSVANTTNRQGLAGARSGLFWRFVDALKQIQPKYFLFENVASMTAADRAIITQALGVEPILINSGTHTPQQRKRLYWCNWNITQPPQKNIYVKDIAEPITTNVKTIVNFAKGQNKTPDKTMLVGYISNNTSQHSRVYFADGKAATALVNNHGFYQFTLSNGTKIIRPLTPVEYERLQGLPDNYTAGVSNTQRYKQVGNGWQVDTIKHIISCNPNL